MEGTPDCWLWELWFFDMLRREGWCLMVFEKKVCIPRRFTCSVGLTPRFQLTDSTSWKHPILGKICGKNVPFVTFSKKTKKPNVFTHITLTLRFFSCEIALTKRFCKHVRSSFKSFASLKPPSTRCRAKALRYASWRHFKRAMPHSDKKTSGQALDC